jgi:glucose-1-phosphate thymidylyltransferase
VKGLVLAGGSGTRLRPITFSMAKQLIPVANKPIIEFGLEDLAEAGVTSVGVIISPETGSAIRRAVEPAAARIGIDVTFILQEAPLGLAHALRTALPFIDGDECLMYLGDNLVKSGVADIVRDFTTRRPNCQIMLSPVDNPSAFGVADLGEDGTIRRLVEKPAVPPSNLALVGVYLFDATIAEAVDAIEPSARGEYEITDAIQYLVETGREVRASIVSGWWKDTGTRDDLLAAQHLVIAEMAHEVLGDLVDTSVEGDLHLGAGSTLRGCTVIGPVVVGEGVEVRDSVIGPEVSIGDGCTILGSEVEHSIVMSGSRLAGWKLRSSIVGRESSLDGRAPSEPVTVVLGERSEILG